MMKSLILGIIAVTTFYGNNGLAQYPYENLVRVVTLYENRTKIEIYLFRTGMGISDPGSGPLTQFEIIRTEPNTDKPTVLTTNLAASNSIRGNSANLYEFVEVAGDSRVATQAGFEIGYRLSPQGVRIRYESYGTYINAIIRKTEFYNIPIITYHNMAAIRDGQTKDIKKTRSFLERVKINCERLLWI